MSVGLAPLLNAVYTSTRDGEKILKRLTKAAGFTAENVVARLAIARSLAEPPRAFDASLEGDAEGKQIKGFTLLGRQDIASPLVAMIAELHGQPADVDELRRLVRLHWERGLRLIDAESAGSDMQTLLLEYAQRALLSDSSSRVASVSPRTVLSDTIVGQSKLREELGGLVEAAAGHEPPLFEKAVLLVGPDGSGKRTIAIAVASSLQLPFVDVDAGLLENPVRAQAGIEQQLAVQGYARQPVASGRFEYPPCILYIEPNADMDLSVIARLGSRRTFTTWGEIKVRLSGGAVFIGSTSEAPVTSADKFEMTPYTRDEVADILRRTKGSWPLEIRRLLALKGRLNPGRAVEAANEFFALARDRGERPSEGLLLQIMQNEWGVDRLGLSPSDYRILAALRDEAASADADPLALAFFERLGLIKDRAGTWVLATRGLEALNALQLRDGADVDR